ncbi:hypothetical protein Q73A0000_03580 [Kaistella flava (ex Peng et al. 2021)]|uniref:Uncharacterized protein n=1 Tax=Kaistella flava (ex Peng et al. 2021) TaxID=2038776 RepID=A0A7M2Y5Z0_9FLAO|nr:hypothetical protein [Kaistella flava (ex Peng et al. 2021)]QOW09510.1 hypothetical protein Q73A0000_03580 [Kaistella flava (ex Peng et al. 2021)]
MKKLLFLILIGVSCNIAAQKWSCGKLINFLQRNIPNPDRVETLNSNTLVKVEFFLSIESGYVIAYFKKKSSDKIKNAKIYFWITRDGWDEFKLDGMQNGYDKAFSTYIEKYKYDCE